MKGKRVVAVAVAVLLAVGMLGWAGGKGEGAGAEGFTIGFSNSYGGNTYRQTMEALFKTLADQMVADGTLKSYKMLQSNNNNATQVSQIESLILEGVNAIIIDPGSGSALNGAIEKAVKAKIPVVIVNDGPVTSELAYQILWDTDAMASDAVVHLAELMNKKGNIIEIRGLAGNAYDDAFHASAVKALSAYPDIKVVGLVYGEWTESVAQQQVASILPGIPQVDGILGQGGDEYGALQAFLAAGRPVPIIIGGNRGNFLKWWADQKARTGYKSFSWAANPWSAASGLYVAVDILRGVQVPRTMIMPALSITQDMVDNFASLKADEVAAKAYDHDWIVKTYYKK